MDSFWTHPAFESRTAPLALSAMFFDTAPTL